jgi:hypothetical protein
MIDFQFDGHPFQDLPVSFAWGCLLIGARFSDLSGANNPLEIPICPPEEIRANRLENIIEIY